MWALKRLGDPAITPDGTTRRGPGHHLRHRGEQGPHRPVADARGRRRARASSPATRPATPSPRSAPTASGSPSSPSAVTTRESQIYVIAVGRRRSAARHQRARPAPSVPKWFPDSRRIAFVSEVWPDLVRWEDQARAQEGTRGVSKMTARVWTQAPISYFDHFLDDREPHLFSIGARRRRADGDHAHVGLLTVEGRRSTRPRYDISPDGLEVAFTRERRQARGIDPQLRRDRAARPAAASRRATSPPATRPTTTRRATARTAGGSRSRSSASRRFYARPRAADAVRSRRRHHAWAHRELGPQRSTASSGSAIRAALLGTIDDAGTRRVYRFRLDGGDARGAHARRRASARWRCRGNGKALVAHPPELHRAADAGAARRAQRRGDQAVRRSTTRALAGLDSGQGGERHLQGRAATTTSRCGWSIHPASIATKKYPVCMLLHGGPHNAMTDAVQWRWNARGVRELGLRRDVAQLPRLERLRQRLHRLDQSRLGHAAVRGHDQGGATG